jgi:nitrogen fixation protein
MRNEWVKIQTFDRIHQAELRKDILEKNEIASVIINEQDSLFLTGLIELYVCPEDEKRAKALIDEFEGLTKINTFVELKPILVFQSILQENGIETILKKKEDTRYIADNFELYVKNEDLEKAISFLTGEKLIGWAVLDKFKKVRQTRYRVELLSEKIIESIVIKKKDSDYHLEEVVVYVKNEDLSTAREIMEQLNGWISVRETETLSECEILDELLAEKEIKSLICKTEKGFEIKVEASNEEIAIDIINRNSEWVELAVYDSLVKSVYHRDLLIQNNIPAVIINEMDSTFLLGGIELHVEKTNIKKALEIINDTEKIEK